MQIEIAIKQKPIYSTNTEPTPHELTLTATGTGHEMRRLAEIINSALQRKDRHGKIL